MKNIIIIFLLLFNFLYIYSEEDLPSIKLPKIEIEFEDIKNLEISSNIDLSIPDFNFNINVSPDLTKNIIIDLEKTLPKIIDKNKQKPIDALIKFGYGLNNYLFADFSIYVKQYNPKISVHYLRKYKENLWFNKPEEKNSTSLDDLNAQLLYYFKNFSLNIDSGFFSNSYKLQDNSIYDLFTKRILNFDLTPSIRFNFQNELSLIVLNSFLFTDINNFDNVSRNDYNYILDSKILYTQIFGHNHFISTYTGYNFNYLYKLIDGNKTELKDDYNQNFHNIIKAGASYSTTFKEDFSIKGAFDFYGLFEKTNFYWYLLPNVNFGYSLFDYFHCYIDGGAKLINNTTNYWYKNNNYVSFPISITPGYHWYAKTGIKGSFPGWITGYVNFEFAYNLDGYNWKISNKYENLYEYEKYNFIELNLNSGLIFQFREYIKLKIDWIHYFYERMYLTAQDNLLAEVIFGIPNIGLSFNINFNAQFNRLNINNELLNNIYLLNAGINWNWKDRFGLGVDFNNILYFNSYQLFPDYEEEGFEFLAYVKIGF